MLPPRQEQYVQEVANRLRAALGDDLLAVFLVGSAALGDWVPERSDIDVMAVCAGPLSAAQRDRLVESLLHRALPCPARGLELVVYIRDAIGAPRRGLGFELNLNTGAGVGEHVSSDPGAEPAHWFLLDVSAARLHGRAISGPAPQALIGAVPAADVHAALIESLRWHREHEATSANAVLNACRSWRYAAEGTWSSKPEAGRWALEHGADDVLVRRALASHAGASGQLDARAVATFLADVAARLGHSSGA
ncbi:MAG: hypothetical protein QOH62_1161 [Solirubrobacteraceae bacterium]|nr:hypothetical protein [Solirubrobacteraceae bacterium]